jgi:hypothetical protein
VIVVHDQRSFRIANFALLGRILQLLQLLVADDPPELPPAYRVALRRPTYFAPTVEPILLPAVGMEELAGRGFQFLAPGTPQQFHARSDLLIRLFGSFAVFLLVSFFFIPVILAQNESRRGPPSG